jgi:tetraacyldisaccharide 4'-kinase
MCVFVGLGQWRPLNEEAGRLWDILLFPLSLISVFYRLIQELRAKLYATGIISSRELPCKVISVGNITSGGTGKTPVVELLVRLLQDQGFNVAVLSRGYKRQDRGSVLVVSDGKKILLDPWQAGDEPYLLARNLKNTPVLVGKNRCRAGEYAWQNFGIDLVILDDGFQHLALKRDLNILLLDASNPFANHKVLPRGLLREPLNSLGRAHALILTRVQEKPHPEIFYQYHKAGLTIPVFQTRQQGQKLINTTTGEERAVECLKGKKILAFCGIGNPDSFRGLIQELGGNLVRFMPFKDHHKYKISQLKKINQRSKALSADMVLTTEKDYIRLIPYHPFDFPLWYVKISMEFIKDQDAFQNLLLQHISISPSRL